MPEPRQLTGAPLLPAPTQSVTAWRVLLRPVIRPVRVGLQTDCA